MLSVAKLDELRRSRPLSQVAASLGLKLNRRGAGPCPFCGGGKSSQRFEIKQDRWVCACCDGNGAGGDVISFVARFKKLPFREAIDWLGGPPKVDAAESARLEAEAAARKARRETEAAEFREAERRRLYGLWRRAQPFLGTPVETYLRGRGLRRLDDLRLRYFEALAFFHGDEIDELGRKRPRVIFRGPAMVAPFVNDAGRFIGLHLTWIDAANPGSKASILDPDTGERLNPKKMRGHKLGGYLDVFRGGDDARVYAGEGIETVASVRDALDDGAAYRVAGDLGNLAGRSFESVKHPTLKDLAGRARRVPGPQPDLESEAMPVPAQCRELVLLQDGDSDPFTTEMAMRRAASRHAAPGRVVRIAAAPEGADFNDVLQGRA